MQNFLSRNRHSRSFRFLYSALRRRRCRFVCYINVILGLFVLSLSQIHAGRKRKFSLATTLCHSLAHLLSPSVPSKLHHPVARFAPFSLSLSLPSSTIFCFLRSLTFAFFLFLRQLLRRSLAGAVLNSSLLRIAVYLRVLTGKSSAMHNTANDPPRVFRESPLETFGMQ